MVISPLKKLSSSQIKHKEFDEGEIKLILTNTQGNNASIVVVKVTTENAGLKHAHRELKIFIKSMLIYRCNC